MEAIGGAAGEIRQLAGLKTRDTTAARAAGAYFVLAGGWILYSDRLIAQLREDMDIMQMFQESKGLAFVLVTSVLLYFYLRHQHKREQRALVERMESQREMIRLLAQAADWRDDETGDHVLRVAAISHEIAKAYGLPKDVCETIKLAATTHDIGKIGIPDEIVLFPSTYDSVQRAKMQAHTLIGGQILRGADGPLLDAARQIALSHHERWDGAGYPAGLRAAEIPLEARIVALADVFDALVSPRRYKDPWPWDAAMATIREGAGTQFDPEVVAAFLAVESSVRRVWASYFPPPRSYDGAERLDLTG